MQEQMSHLLPDNEELPLMPFLLLMLLAAIALIITLIGYLLTSNPQSHSQNQRTPYHPGYYRIQRRRNAREPLSTHRVVAYTEQNMGAKAPQSLFTGLVLGRQRVGESVPWTGISLVLFSIFLLGIFLLRTLLPGATLIGAMPWSNAATTLSSHSKTSSSAYNASKLLVRIGQLDPDQYNSPQEYNLWAYSACSAAAMTEVFNAYGRHYRVTDVLKVEARIGEITPQLGLLEDSGIEHTAAQFGFKTSWGHNLSLDALVEVANNGRPVIVSFPPDRYDGGHILVVTGGNKDYVYLADTSRWNRKSLTRAQFMQWWEGYTAIVTPN